MPTIKGGFTLRKGEDVSKNAALMSVMEKDGVFTPFDANNTTMSNPDAEKIKLLNKD